MAQRTREQCVEILKEQIYLLNKSCKDYDDGDHLEAIRIAGHLRTLLYDGPNSQSLLSLLDIKKTLIIFDNKMPDSQPTGIHVKPVYDEQGRQQFIAPLHIGQLENIRYYAGLLVKEFEQVGKTFSVKYVPVFKYAMGKAVDFNSWWNSTIFNDHDGYQLTRQDVVKMIANKDGYSHVDENPPLRYLTFKNQEIHRFELNGKLINPDGIPVYPAVRQIAFELLECLNKLAI